MRTLAISILALCSSACSGKTIVNQPPGDPASAGDSRTGGDGMCDVTETCDDGIDNDCNGSIDDGCACPDNDTRACGSNEGECLEGVQTCTGCTWGMCTGGQAPIDETCDGLDNNCDGEIDEGCPCQGTETQPCGSDIGECEAGTQTCDNGAWGACDGATGSVAELCDGLDNDCDEVDDNGLSTRPAANHDGECSDNTESCDGSNGWVADAGNYVPVAELCDGLDNDCAGGVDDGLAPRPATNIEGECIDNVEICDGASGWVDDGGNYVPVPEICDTLDNDCAGGVDDGLAGATEICDDDIDNNCDGMTDLEDTTACPTIDVSISALFDPIELHHGSLLNLQANIVPNDSADEWARVWEITAATGGADCDPADIGLDDQQEDAWRTRIRITDLADDVTRLACTYTLTVTVNGYATDSVDVVIVNDAPELLSVAGAVFDGSAWMMTLAAGSTPDLVANAWDPESDGLVFEWSGADVGELACAPCTSSDTSPGAATVSWGGAIAPGTYLLTVELMDDFDPSVRVLADIIVDVDNCLWAIQGGGSGDGSGATVNDAGDTIQTLLAAAVGAADTDVCVLGAGTFTENLHLVASATNTPDLLGGFSITGAPDETQRPEVRVSVDAGVTFDPGYDGTVKNLNLAQTAFSPGIADPATVTIEDALPTLLNCWVAMSRGTEPVGIEIRSSGGLGALTAPVINGGMVEPAGMVDDAIAIRLSEAVGGDAAATILNLDWINTGNGLNAGGGGDHIAIHLTEGTFAEIAGVGVINATSSDGLAVGVRLEPGAEASIHDNGMIRGNGGLGAVAIFLQGTDVAPVRADIERNTEIVAEPNLMAAPFIKVGIAMLNNDGTVIADNERIRSQGDAGSLFDAAIADGSIERNGTLTSGLSTNVAISGNAEIRGGTFWENRGSCAEGPDVSVGILLVGTSDSTIAGNGRPTAQAHGIVGGMTSVHWTPATRRLIPSNPGLWLIDTTNVVVADNEVRSGSLWQDAAPPPGCNILQPPAAIGYRDGVPANPDSGDTASGRSRATVFTRNGVACEVPMQSGVAPGSMETWCVAVELNAPNAGPTLSNNVLAATRGNYLVSLRQRGGAAVVAINNTLDTDLTLLDWELETLPPDSVTKWPLLLEEIDNDGITLVNNIFVASDDNKPSDGTDLDLERICIVDVVADAAAGSSISALTTSLFHIDNNSDGDPYVRVTDGTDTDYDDTELNVIAGATCTGNFADVPGLSVADTDWEKSTVRLLPGSAAINRGTVVETLPPVDMDREHRPDPTSGLPDIGHDEVP